MPEKTDPIAAQLPSLRRYALSLTRDAAEAEDLVQDALLRGHEQRRTYRTGGDLRAWLFSILRNRFVDHHRSRAAQSRREAEHAAMTPLAIEAPQEASIRLAQLRGAFMDLPAEQREALSLVAIEGLSYAEAAAMLELPIGTVMSRLHRARRSLGAAIGEGSG